MYLLAVDAYDSQQQVRGQAEGHLYVWSHQDRTTKTMNETVIVIAMVGVVLAIPDFHHICAAVVPPGQLHSKALALPQTASYPEERREQGM